MANLPIDYQKIHLLKILPKNISADNNIQELSSVLDDELQKICKVVDNLNLIDKIDVLPEEIVNLLAWQWHVDYYDNTLPLQNKRRLVKESIRVHKTKGTAWAVENVVKSALGDSRIEEWYEYGGEPYTFRIINEVNTVGKSISMDKLVKCINSVKNVRSHLDGITLERKLELSGNNKIRCGIIPVLTGRKTIGIGFPGGHQHKVYTGVVHAITGHKTIGISKPEPVSIQSRYGIIHFVTGRKTIGGIK